MRTITRGVTAVVAAGALSAAAPPAEAQWAAAPAVALGLAVPGGALHDAVAEGATAKVGLWMRAPRVPVGFTTEAMYTHLRGGRTMPRSSDMRIASILANVTTRRHEGRLDPYGTLGAGWYWYTDPDRRFRGSAAPGVNVGIGEVIALADRDYFVEVRVHAIRTPTPTGHTWTTFLPLMLGVRF